MAAAACCWAALLLPTCWAAALLRQQDGDEPPAPGDTSCGTPPAPLATDGRKNVLIIGDSISMGYGYFKQHPAPPPHPSDRAWPDGRLGYGLYVKEALAANASVQHCGGWYLGGQAGDSGGTQASGGSWKKGQCDGCGGGMRCLKQWLGSNSSSGYLPWDVISVNFGLHDLGGSGPVREVPIDQYRKNMAAIFAELNKTGAELIFTTTTPVPSNYPPGSRTEKNVVAYNAAAKEIAQSLGNVAINDLHGAIVAACPKTYPADGNCSALQWPKGVHFVHAGRVLCGQHVSTAIVSALARRAARPAPEKVPADIVWRNTCLRGTACSSFELDRSGAYSFVASAGAPPLTGSVGPASGLSFHATNGDDSSPLGEYQQLAVSSEDITLTVRYYPRADAFVFSRLQKRVLLPWPRFQFTRQVDSSWGAMSWTSGGAMVTGEPAASLRTWAAAHPAGTENATLHGSPGGFGGPVVLWHKSNVTANQEAPLPEPVIAMAALDHWDSNQLLMSKESATYRDGCDEEGPGDDCWLAAGVAALSIVPATGVQMSTVLLGRPGLQRATRALGSVLRNVHNSTRLRDANVETLSYWSDNAAGYSFWSVPGNDLDIWGPVGALYLKLHEEYMRAGIAFGSWESDNTMGRIPSIDSAGKTHGGWCFEDWTRWNRTLYPTGGSVSGDGWPAKMRALQNSAIQSPMQFVYYIYYLCHDNVWRRNASSPFRDAFVDVGPWRGTAKPLNYGRGDQSVTLLHPDRSRGFYLDIMGRARDEWGMTMLFKDDLADQGERITQFFPERFGVKLTWLKGLTGALAELGLSMQACMTAPMEILASVDGMGAITNARVSGDGGISVASAAMGSLLTSMVGIGWSKDNIKTRTVSASNPPCCRMGVQSCYQFCTSRPDGFPELQMLLATLSLGPVGITDPLSEGTLPGPWAQPVWPSNTTITSNVSIVKAAISLNGSLLQPSYPITPSASTLQRLPNSQGGWAVWSTYTSVPTASGKGVAASHFTAVGFIDDTISSSEAAAVSNAAAQPQCTWQADADKSSGHMIKRIANSSRAECCAACFAMNAGGVVCDAYVRDPVANTCFLITGTTNNATRHATNREVGFLNEPPPPPVIESVWPGTDLLPMVDAEAPALKPFAEPPASFFLGSGSVLAAKQYVYSAGAPIAPDEAAESDAADSQCATWVEPNAPVPFHATASPAPQQINLSPWLRGARAILIGEAHKYAAVSVYRFGSIEVLPSGALSIALRGNVGEAVSLRYVEVTSAAELGLCKSKSFALTKNGETTVTLP